MRGTNGKFLTLRSLFFAMAIIQLVTAASGTLVALDFAKTGASQEAASLAPAFYSLGFLIGCFYVGGWLSRIGHVRAFAAGAAICIASTLMFSLSELVPVLLFVRFVTGVATAGLFAIGDAWLSESTDEGSRGRLLAIYAVSLGVMSFVSQLLIQVLPENLNDAFVMLSLVYCIAIVVLSAARTAPPSIRSSASVRIIMLLRNSPTAWIGSFVVGMVATILLNVVPYRASVIGVSNSDIALWVGAIYLGRILMQYALGQISDKRDRRIVIMIAAMVSSVLLFGMATFVTGDGSWYFSRQSMDMRFAFIGLLVVLGGMLLTMYSILVAHAMDRTVPVFVSSASVTMLFVNTAGAVCGPILASVVSFVLGDASLFWILWTMMAGFAGFTALRIFTREGAFKAEKTTYVTVESSSVEVMPQLKRRG